ncbi:MAG: glutamate racemase [Candidatus Omnitrophota bacterium]|jgi:glutamate racemase
MKSLRNRPIGVFDSGVGGLTVVRSMRRLLPEEDIIYFGDTARVPYGNKSRSTITRFAREIMAFMTAKRVKMVVVACNTASSLSLPLLNKEYSVPVLGVITAGVKEAARVSRNKRIGVIGTSSTVSSGAYDKELFKLGGKHKVYSKACPLFVPLVENRHLSDPITYQVAKKYLGQLKKKHIDTLILGCTHYPLVKKVVKDIMGNVELVDSSIAVAKDVKERLAKEGLRSEKRRSRGKTRYYVSDDPEGFSKIAGIFLKEKVKAKRANL